jgi:uncharacterized membrane protein HdeD (DUF308 family)
MTMPNASPERLARAAHEHWVLFLVEGVVLLIVGLAAFAVPVIATLAVSIFLGWLFLVAGVMGLISTFMIRTAPGFWWSLISALAAIAAGLVLLGSPVTGALSLTFVVISFFFLEGIVSIMFALDHKRELSGNWGWMVVSGIVDLFLGGFLLVGLPSSAVWAVGLLVGINMIVGGTALIAMALRARTAA